MKRVLFALLIFWITLIMVISLSGVLTGKPLPW